MRGKGFSNELGSKHGEWIQLQLKGAELWEKMSTRGAIDKVALARLSREVRDLAYLTEDCAQALLSLANSQTWEESRISLQRLATRLSSHRRATEQLYASIFSRVTAVTNSTPEQTRS